MSQPRGDTHKANKENSLRYIVLLSGLVIFIALMATTFILVERGKTINNSFLALSSEQRLLTRSLVTQAFEAIQGNAEAFDRLRDTKERFTEILELQTNGGRYQEITLPSADAESKPRVEELSTQWKPIATLSLIHI